MGSGGRSYAATGKAEDVGPDVGNLIDLVEFNFADEKKKIVIHNFPRPRKSG